MQNPNWKQLPAQMIQVQDVYFAKNEFNMAFSDRFKYFVKITAYNK